MAIPLVGPRRPSEGIEIEFLQPLQKEKGGVPYYLLKLFLEFLRLLPWAVGRFMARRAGFFLYHLLPKRRALGGRRMKEVFGDSLGDREIKKLMKAHFQHLFLLMLEISKIPAWDDKGIKKRIKIEGQENYHAALKKGKGAIIVTGHFGNFVLMGHAGSILLNPIYFVFRLDKKKRWLNRLVVESLCHHGNIAISRGGAMLPLREALQKGAGICTMIDQRGGSDDRLTKVPFLGKQFLFNKGTALLAQQTEAPVLPVYNFREKNGDFRIVWGKEIPMIKTQDPEADLQENTARILASLEDAIRKQPELWLHWPCSRFEKDFSGKR